MTMHEEEIVLADETGRALIAEQFPQWSDVPVRRIDTSGTVNAIFRIGDGHAARFPLQGAGPDATLRVLEAEAEASAEFAGVSTVPTPEPAGIGRPGEGYPLPWSVQTWVGGTDASEQDTSDSVDFARDLATLIAALRAGDTRGRTFSGDNRGGHLPDHDEWVEECLEKSRHLLNVPRLTVLWQHFRDLPRTGKPDVMNHGDLIPANVLVADGRLTGVLDCGGFAAADPALDVIAGWHLLADGPREVFRSELGCDDLEWERSKAWAFEQAMGAVWYYDRTNPAMARMGRQTLARVVAATPV